jgi:hypothetical protein
MKKAYTDLLTWLADRLKEPSTWRGVIWLLTSLGIAIDPEKIQALILAASTLTGVILVFSKENSKPKN